MFEKEFFRGYGYIFEPEAKPVKETEFLLEAIGGLRLRSSHLFQEGLLLLEGEGTQTETERRKKQIERLGGYDFREIELGRLSMLETHHVQDMKTYGTIMKLLSKRTEEPIRRSGLINIIRESMPEQLSSLRIERRKATLTEKELYDLDEGEEEISIILYENEGQRFSLAFYEAASRMALKRFDELKAIELRQENPLGLKLIKGIIRREAAIETEDGREDKDMEAEEAARRAIRKGPLIDIERIRKKSPLWEIEVHKYRSVIDELYLRVARTYEMHKPKITKTTIEDGTGGEIIFDNFGKQFQAMDDREKDFLTKEVNKEVERVAEEQGLQEDLETLQGQPVMLAA